MAELSENKCKNCSADLDLRTAKGGVLTCPYCRSVFTLPKEKAAPKVLAFLRSGEQNLDMRRFDDAYIMYQKAAEEDPNEPEAYFGMALSKAQVQYLKDYCASGKEVSPEKEDSDDFRMQPICYEISEKKFTDDQNFRKAIELATPEQQAAYREKGDEIDRIRAEFSVLKQSGLSYDCFICVKVSAEGGKGHTEDSHIALQLYHDLKDAGYRPFYSEEEMKDRVGVRYEAFILYALYSSKCMLVVCTNEDYLQTPWVKNEYTRYMKMLVEEEKQRDSITIAFMNTPIEKLPGLSGKLQGINMGSYDGLQRVLKFVDRFAAEKEEIPEIVRKDYSATKVTKKSAIKQEIVKRKIEIVNGGTLAVSDQIKLKNAEDFMSRGDFSRATRFCMEVIRENPASGEAYWLLFLAENGCREENELVYRTAEISDFRNFERALSTTSDRDKRMRYYLTLADRVKERKELSCYLEYIALPEAPEETIVSLTDTMYQEALRTENREMFDHVIKTVSDPDRYVKMNLGFAHALPRQSATEYFRNVLKADESNQEALYECFIVDHQLQKDGLFAYCSDEANRTELENGLFSYGFNAYAMEKLMAIVQQNVPKQPAEASSLFDFLLAMIPKKNDKMFKEHLTLFIKRLFECEQYEIIVKYNNLLLSLDEFDDGAYFNRVLLSRKINNPLALMKEADKLLDDENYMSAYNAYAAKHEQDNFYLQFIDALKTLAESLTYPECINYIAKNVWITEKEEVLNCSERVSEVSKRHAHDLWRKFLSDYKVDSEEKLFRLKKDISDDRKLKLILKFATVANDKPLCGKVLKIIHKQGESARVNQATAERAVAKKKKITLINAIATPILLLVTFGIVYLSLGIESPYLAGFGSALFLAVSSCVMEKISGKYGARWIVLRCLLTIAMTVVMIVLYCVDIILPFGL